MKSDMLYQIYFRLAKDIFQNNLTYGGIAMVVLGDILQLKPPLGSFVFNEPRNEKSKMVHAIDPLWKRFEVITLKTNKGRTKHMQTY